MKEYSVAGPIMFELTMFSILCREMLTSVLRALIKNSVKESFYGKRKKIN